MQSVLRSHVLEALARECLLPQALHGLQESQGRFKANPQRLRRAVRPSAASAPLVFLGRFIFNTSAATRSVRGSRTVRHMNSHVLGLRRLRSASSGLVAQARLHKVFAFLALEAFSFSAFASGSMQRAVSGFTAKAARPNTSFKRTANSRLRRLSSAA